MISVESSSEEISDLADLLKRDIVTAVHKVRQLADQGDVTATVLLAQMYAEGKGVSCDPSLAVHYFSVGASLGSADAMNMVGRCHDLGFGTPEDPVLAVAWYRHAADSGSLWGSYNLGNSLATGRGVAQDQASAYAEYLRAANQGHAKAMNLVGRYLEDGLVAAADPGQALQWYLKSAHAGDFRGQTSLASILVAAGRVDEAEAWLRKAIASGSPAFLKILSRELEQSNFPNLRNLADLCRAPTPPQQDRPA